MHSYYRARIASAFLPHLTDDDSDTDTQNSMAYQLHQMTPTSGAPLHLINTTMNTSTSKIYKLRSREGASFTLSPLFSGSPLCGYQKTEEFMGHGVPLSTAATISGAAVDPNNSIIKSRPISILMSLFNFRLGFWATSPRTEGLKRWGADWYTLVGREVLGVGLDESSRHIHLSDGGQFENLGVYELIRRRCGLIIACDSGADPNYTLSDLAKMINLCKADFNARVEICALPMIEQHQSGQGFCPIAMGHINYDDGSTGEILYIKSMLFEKLPANVYSYASTSPTFPNESTANQFYGEAQFDAYETLGRTIIERLADGSSDCTVADLLERARHVVGD